MSNDFHIDDEGFRLIRSFEGYGKKLANGDCCAYQTPLKGGLDIPTIGYGCTEGVRMGMVWTKDQAEAALRREIAKHELAVSSLVKVALNQNQINACVSLSYNIGTGIGSKNRGFANSSVLSNINAGDMTAASKAFLLYDRAKGQVEPGLVSRRTRESALFQKPAIEPDTPWMPQGSITASPPSVPPSWWQQKWKHLLGVLGLGGGAGAEAVHPQLPSADQLFSTAQTYAPQVKTIFASGLVIPAITVVGAYIIIGHLLPWVMGGSNADS